MKTTETILRQIAPRLSSKHKDKVTQNYILKELALVFDGLCEEFELNTNVRKTMFLAQTCHESAGFRTMQEFASGKAYEGRTDLGNTHPGDGVRFKGHGIIQITGRDNHSAFTTWAQAKYPDAPDFVEHPEKLMEFPWAIIAAFWYWESRGLNAWADKGDFRKVTKLINGGYNGLADRRKYLAKAEMAYEIITDHTSALLRLGSEGADVIELQTRLKQLHYRIGDVDGDFGSLTEAGVRDFQADQALVVDGKVRVGGETWSALGTALEAADVRPIAKKRVDATGADLKDSRIIASSDEANGATILTGLSTGVFMYWEQAQEFVGQWVSSPNVFLGGSVALNIYLLSRIVKARLARLDDHKRGKTL